MKLLSSDEKKKRNNYRPLEQDMAPRQSDYHQQQHVNNRDRNREINATTVFLTSEAGFL